jgi:hypothetical protein
MTDKLETTNGFQQNIFTYLMNYHPYVFENREEAEEMIIRRANNAHAAYIQADKDGEAPYECEQAALQALYAGLEFSPVTYLIEVGIEATGYEMNDKEACNIYRLPEVKEIFERYGTEIEGDPREYALKAELTPYFEKYKK